VNLRAWLPVLLAAAGCGPAYVYGRTSRTEVAPRPQDCHFDLLDQIPQRAYEEVGIVAAREIEYGSAESSTPMFVDTVRGWVCGSGGEAVIVERDMYGHYLRGTVVRFK